MRSIGLDIGTTTISAVVVDLEKQSVEKAYTIENGSFISTEENWHKIQDPGVIIQKAQGLLNEILDKYDGIRWIGLTGQMHGIVYVDKDGKHVSPLYTWQDGSGDQRYFDDESICTKVYQKCGIKVYTGYGVVTHVYHAWKKQIPEETSKICTIADYLGMMLAGRREPLVHSGNAASMGFYDVEKAGFMCEELENLGIDVSILPQVTDSYEIQGTYRGIPVMTAIGDNQASFLGSVKIPEKSVLVNMGTGGQISVFSDKCCHAEGIETRPFNEGKYLIVGSSLCGGRAYAILENFFRMYAEAAGIKGLDHYDIMSKILEQADHEETAFGESERLKITTTFSGTRENPVQRGSVTNIGISNFTPADMIRGVLEGMAEELYSMYRLIDESVLSDKTTMVVSGNGIRKNPHLQRIMEKKFGLKLQNAQNKEEAAYGAALTGMAKVK